VLDDKALFSIAFPLFFILDWQSVAPIIATWLLSQAGHWWPVAAWMALTAAAGIVGVALARPVNDDVEASPEVTQVSSRGTALTSRPTLDKPGSASA
jgi:hypothetical protein